MIFRIAAIFTLAASAQGVTPASVRPVGAIEATQQVSRIAGMFDPPPAGKGQIIFYRPGGAGLGCMVREGEGAAEIHLSKLTSKRYFIHYAQPGKHRYWTKNLAKDSLNLEVEDGETYFVKCEIAIGLMSSNPNLLPSDVTEFERSKDKLSPMAD